MRKNIRNNNTKYLTNNVVCDKFIVNLDNAICQYKQREIV